MKISTLLTTVFLLAFQYGIAQINPLADNLIVQEFEFEDNWFQDIEAKLTLVYKGTTPATLVWEREVVVVERDWETAVCDPVLCYLPHVNKQSFKVEPDEEFDMAVHLYPRGNDGDSARVILTLYDENDPEETFSFTYVFINSRLSSTESPEFQSRTPSLYPNPAGEFFNIQNDLNVASVEIFNVVGQLSISIPHISGNKIELRNMRHGLYFVKLLDDQGVTIRTLRLNKK